MKRRLTLAALLIAFFAPVIIAVLLHSRWLEWRPEPERSHGQLIEPVVDIRDRLPGGDWTDKWHLVRVVSGPCADDCLESLYWLRQVRAAQNRHMPDIGLVLVTPASVPAPTRAEIERISPVWRILDGARGRDLSAALPESPGPATYIMDPQTNIMMRYPADTDPNGIRKDLKRLLTWTREE